MVHGIPGHSFTLNICHNSTVFAILVTRIFVKMSQNSGKEIPLTELNVGQLNHLSQQLDQVYIQDDFIAGLIAISVLNFSYLTITC